MNNLNEMDQDMLLNALLMSSAAEAGDDFAFESDDDFDEQYDDDEESWDDPYGFESDDDDDEMLMEGDDDDFGESFSEARRGRRFGNRRSFKKAPYRRSRSPKLRQVRGSSKVTMRAPNGQQMKVQFGKSYATTAEVNKLIKSTETKFAAAMKERKANHAALTKQIAKATSTIDSKIATVNKKVKALESRAQTSSLLGLLSGPPAVKTIKLGNGPAQEAKIEYEPADLTLPLLLGGMGGSSGSGDNNTLLLALMLGQNKDKK